MTVEATRTKSQKTGGSPSARSPEAEPPHRRVARALVRILHALYAHHALDAASAMAFHFFLSLIPLLVVLGYVLGLLVRQRGVEAFMAPLLEAAPEAATEIVRHELERLAGATASPIAPLGVLGFLWIASSGAHGLMNVFEIALGARQRPWWKKRLIALGWIALSIVAISITAWGALALEARFGDDEAPASVAEPPPVPPPPSAHPHRPSAPAGSTPSAQVAPAHSSPPGASPPKRARATHPVRRRVARLLESRAERLGIAALTLVLGVCGLALFYRFAVEHPPGVRRRAWPGAFVAMTAFLLVSWGFGVYVAQLGSYALFYGGLAAVAVLLFWFYLSSLALLLGAEVNAQLEGVRDNPST